MDNTTPENTQVTVVKNNTELTTASFYSKISDPMEAITKMGEMIAGS